MYSKHESMNKKFEEQMKIRVNKVIELAKGNSGGTVMNPSHIDIVLFHYLGFGGRKGISVQELEEYIADNETESGYLVQTGDFFCALEMELN